MNISPSIYAADPLNIVKVILSVLNDVESIHVDVIGGRYTAALDWPLNFHTLFIT